MGKYTNSYVLGEVLRALYHVAGRRTTNSFAAKVIGSIIKTLEQKYIFLKYVRIEEGGELLEDEAIAIAPEIENVNREQIGDAIESIVRVVYMDIIGKAGLFFIAELKRRAGDELIDEIQNFGVDLASLQIEQHYLYRSRERKKAKVKKPHGDVSLLGYTWKNVSSWEYDQRRKVCVLYSKEGEILDTLNLDSIIEDYVKNLTDVLDEIPEELEENYKLNNKEYGLLKMLQSRDMDADSAMTLLHATKKEFDDMIKRLLEKEFLQYTSFNVIELTEIGISYIQKREQEQKPNQAIKNDIAQ